ncbi:hypothetical protein NQ315_000203 [Exocentrus adspersus]|uniref:Uncharacterized protein n=1 Tax=Exocentrus adspersus TaxID=1586481 RepID=A0AAV8VRE0_9CUCU|nr:hypothetical protein NQ315_000203 [Exocentrus adspersus]
MYSNGFGDFDNNNESVCLKKGAVQTTGSVSVGFWKRHSGVGCSHCGSRKPSNAVEYLLKTPVSVPCLLQNQLVIEQLPLLVNEGRITIRNIPMVNKLAHKHLQFSVELRCSRRQHNIHWQNKITKMRPSSGVRKEEVLAIRSRFPTKIPIIVQRYAKERNLPELDKSKFLVPQEITVSQFQTILRNRIKLNPNQALYLLVDDKSMVSLSLTLTEVYMMHAHCDGFLYITYASQDAFGGSWNVSDM